MAITRRKFLDAAVRSMGVLVVPTLKGANPTYTVELEPQFSPGPGNVVNLLQALANNPYHCPDNDIARQDLMSRITLGSFSRDVATNVAAFLLDGAHNFPTVADGTNPFGTGVAHVTDSLGFVTTYSQDNRPASSPPAVVKGETYQLYASVKTVPQFLTASANELPAGFPTAPVSIDVARTFVQRYMASRNLIVIGLNGGAVAAVLDGETFPSGGVALPPKGTNRVVAYGQNTASNNSQLLSELGLYPKVVASVPRRNGPLELLVKQGLMLRA